MGKTAALGTILRVENPATTGFLVVGNLTNVPAPQTEKQEIDVTDFDSTAVESLPGLPDNGEMAIAGWFNYTDVGQAVLLADSLDPDAPVRTFQLDFTRQDVRFTFDAYVKRFQPQAGGPNEAYRFEGSLRVSGAIVTSAIP